MANVGDSTTKQPRNRAARKKSEIVAARAEILTYFKIVIESTEKKKDLKGKSYISYVIRTKDSNDTKANWETRRRFSEFDELHSILRQKFPRSKLPSLPRKRGLFSYGNSFIEKRRVALQQYLTSLISIGELAKSADIFKFLTEDSKGNTSSRRSMMALDNVSMLALLDESTQPRKTEGWLMKQGTFNKAFKKRYFRLMISSFGDYDGKDDGDEGEGTSVMLQYFKNKKSTKPHGSVALRRVPWGQEMTVVELLEGSTFGINDGERVYILKAETVEGCAKLGWTLSLNAIAILPDDVVAALEKAEEERMELVEEVEEEEAKHTTPQKGANEGGNGQRAETATAIDEDGKVVDDLRKTLASKDAALRDREEKHAEEIKALKDQIRKAEEAATTARQPASGSTIPPPPASGIPPPPSFDIPIVGGEGGIPPPPAGGILPPPPMLEGALPVSTSETATSRGGLLDALKKGRKLKKTTTNSNKQKNSSSGGGGDMRSALLSAIKSGKKLKSSKNRKLPEKKAEPADGGGGGNLMADLMMKLRNRRKHISGGTGSAASNQKSLGAEGRMFTLTGPHSIVAGVHITTLG
eukprot:jgi/Bigna1/127640/aug1.5_g2348